jgi:hypothetical protein
VTLRVTGCLEGSGVASGGHRLPQVVACGLRGSQLMGPREVRNRLKGYGWPPEFMGGLVGSWVAIGGREWPLGVPVDLGGL